MVVSENERKQMTLWDEYLTTAIGPEVTIDYTNWRKERRIRHIRVINFRLSEPDNKYHPKQEWLCWAVDLEINEVRGFALSGINRWKNRENDVAISP